MPSDVEELEAAMTIIHTNWQELQRLDPSNELLYYVLSVDAEGIIFNPERWEEFCNKFGEEDKSKLGIYTAYAFALQEIVSKIRRQRIDEQIEETREKLGFADWQQYMP